MKINVVVPNASINVGTHDGVFHSDEVFACAILHLAFDHIHVTRTRNMNVLNSLVILVDVGGEYDPEKERFDHHQRDFSEYRENGVPYSSCGLVWKKYGPQLYTSEIVNEIDKNLIQHIDAHDCGHELTGSLIEGTSVGATIASIISGFNPGWNDNNLDSDVQFDIAVDFAKEILRNDIRRINGRISARNTVNAFITSSTSDDILVMERFVPWQEQIVGKHPYKFVVFPDTKGSEWRVQAVPKKLHSRETHCLLPESWRGLSGDELNKVVGIEDGVFCHPGRFIAGAESFDSVLSMARQAIEMSK